MKIPRRLLPLLLALCFILSACAAPVSGPHTDLSNLPEYSGSPYVALGGNVPDFSREEFIAAVNEYRRRERRYGLTGEQVK